MRWMIPIAAVLATPAAAAPTYVLAGRLLDPATGTVTADRVIVVQDGRIAFVSPRAPLPGDARIIDLRRYTVLPGLIDLHAHLIGPVQAADPLQPLKATRAQDLADGRRNALATLRAGFTSVRDVGTYRAFTDVALKREIEAGRTPGPRMWVAGAYLTVPHGGGEVTGDPKASIPPEFRVGVAATPDEARAAVKRLLDGGADFIKLIATGAVLTPGTEPGARELDDATLRAAVDAAKARGSYAIAHAHGADGIKAAVRAGARSIEHGSLIDDEGIALMKAQGTFLVADVWNGDWIEAVGTREGWPAETLRKNRETTDAQRQGFAKAVKAGVRIGFGTDAGVFPHGLNARQFAVMTRLGMTPLQAIQSATTSAAEALGQQGRIGCVAPGCHADLIAVVGDPTRDVRQLERVRVVVKAGAVVR